MQIKAQRQIKKALILYKNNIQTFIVIANWYIRGL